MSDTATQVFAEVVLCFGTTDKYAGYCDNCGRSSIGNNAPAAPQFESIPLFTVEDAQGWVDMHNELVHQGGRQGARSPVSGRAGR